MSTDEDFEGHSFEGVYPDVSEMPDDVLVAAIELAEIMLNHKHDKQVAARLELMKAEWEKRNPS